MKLLKRLATSANQYAARCGKNTYGIRPYQRLTDFSLFPLLPVVSGRSSIKYVLPKMRGGQKRMMRASGLGSKTAPGVSSPPRFSPQIRLALQAGDGSCQGGQSTAENAHHL